MGNGIWSGSAPTCEGGSVIIILHVHDKCHEVH